MDWLNNFYMTVLTALLAALGFLVRKIFTSEKKIEILEGSLRSFEEDLREARADIKDILLTLLDKK